MLSCVKNFARKYEPANFLTNFLSVPEAEKYFYVAIEDTCHIGIEKHSEACYASDSSYHMSRHIKGTFPLGTTPLKTCHQQ